MSVRFRRFLTCSAVICWLAAITITAAAPQDGASRLFVLLAATAVALTNGAWISAAFTPFVASHIIGMGAGMRSGINEGRKGKHHKEHKDGNDGRVIPLPVRRLMRPAARSGGT